MKRQKKKGNLRGISPSVAASGSNPGRSTIERHKTATPARLFPFTASCCLHSSISSLKHLLSIPFIGIFALHLVKAMPTLRVWIITFNSLYWDFCFASYIINLSQPEYNDFLSIPFIGIFALHLQVPCRQVGLGAYLSIPFIGIFALHLTRKCNYIKSCV